jgi:cytochrome c553
MKKKQLILYLSAIMLFASEQNITGEQIYNKKGCYGCHGAKGEGVGNYPKLAGKSVYYLTKKLQGYKNKTIHSNRAPIMQSFAAPLTYQEIQALAKFLKNLSNKKEKPQERYFEDYIIGDSSGS